MIEVHPHHAAVMLTIVAQKLLFTKDALLFIKPIFSFELRMDNYIYCIILGYAIYTFCVLYQNLQLQSIIYDIVIEK